MKKVSILILIIFCLSIVSLDTSEAARYNRYNPDLTVSRVTVDAAGNNTGGISIKNIGNRPTGQFEVLVYFKKMDGSYFKQLYRTGNQTKIYPNQTRHYANVFNGSQAVTGLVRVNPHQRFTELNYYNNVAYFSMQKKQVSSYNVTEGVRRYNDTLGYDVVTPTYNGTFSNGAYNPILGNSYITEGTADYVNGIKFSLRSVPLPSHRLIVRGITYSPDRYNKRIYDSLGAYSNLVYDASKNYYYLDYSDSFVPMYLNFASTDTSSWIYDVFNGKLGNISIEIDGQNISSYYVKEVVVYSGEHVLHNATYANGTYNPVVANPPYVKLGGTNRYVNWIGLYFNATLTPKTLTLSGANSTALIKVKDNYNNICNMTWDSGRNCFVLNTSYVPKYAYIDALEYESINSYLFLNSSQQLYFNFNNYNMGYTVYEGYWESDILSNQFVQLYSKTFYDGGYDPIQANPPYTGGQTQYYYVNHLQLGLNYLTPANAVSSLLILKGTTEVDSPPQVQLADDSLIDMIWSSTKNYYFLYIITDLIKSVIINVWDDDYWAYDTLDSFGNIIFEYLYMPRSWSWS